MAREIQRTRRTQTVSPSGTALNAFEILRKQANIIEYIQN
jgi:hypothetical protein